jgi:hypothetical protein
VPRRRRWLPIAAALAALGAAAAIGIAMIGGGGTPTAPNAPTEPASPAPTTVATSAEASAPSEAADTADVEPPAPPEGRVVVDLELPGATVRIGDRELGADELGTAIALAPGSYVVHVEHPEHRPWDGEIEVQEGAEARVEPELEPLPRAVARAPAAPPGTLSINTRPWSRVFVGSRLLGTTPIGEASVPSGTVRLRIVDRDGRTFTRSVRVAPGATESVFYDLDE